MLISACWKTQSAPTLPNQIYQGQGRARFGMYAYSVTVFCFFLKWHHRCQQLGLNGHRHQIEFGPSLVKLDLVELVYHYQFLLPPSYFRLKLPTPCRSPYWLWADWCRPDLHKYMSLLQLALFWLCSNLHKISALCRLANAEIQNMLISALCRLLANSEIQHTV